MPRPRCLIYDLYLTTLGGGERVVFDIAETLKADYDVVVAGPALPTSEQLATFGAPITTPLERMPPWRFPLASRRVDVAIYLANGIPLPSFARRSVVIVQFPMRRIGTNAAARLIERRLLSRYECVVYSEFVRTHVLERWGIDPVVLTPPVELGTYDPAAKKHLILSVGRFFGVQHAKRHDVLIEAFRAIPVEARQGWQLVLAGGFDGSPASQTYLDDLQRAAGDLPVRFETNVERSRLLDLYRAATLFWHATGHGRPADAPERAEHFGISTIEAMSAGAVPLAYADGGQLEIITSDTGILWRSVDELVAATVGLMDDPIRTARLAAAGPPAAAPYDAANFRRRVRQLLEPRRASH